MGSIGLRTRPRDDENIEIFLRDHPQMNVSDAVRWLFEDYRRRHDSSVRESKDQKLDDIREAVGVIDQKLQMLLGEHGCHPVERGKTESPN